MSRTITGQGLYTHKSMPDGRLLTHKHIAHDGVVAAVQKLATQVSQDHPAGGCGHNSDITSHAPPPSPHTHTQQ